MQLQYLKLKIFIISKQKYKLAEMKETPTPSAGQENCHVSLLYDKPVKAFGESMNDIKIFISVQ